MATLKNTIVDDTGSVYLPSGTTAQRPASPSNGAMRYNTTLGYVEFYWMGIWVNAETNRGGVPMSGLIFLADVDNPSSWNGTTLTDISGGNTTITLNGTITQDTTASGSKYLRGGTTAWINIPLNVSSVTSNQYTVMTVSAYNGSNRGRITASGPGGNNWLLGHHSGLDICYYAEGWVTDRGTSGDGTARLNWGVHTGTGRPTIPNGTAIDEWQYWKNGGYQTDTLTGGSAGPTNLSINRWNDGTQPSDWRWQFLAVWNRVLTENEITGLSGAIMARGGF
jgi:hypothetical protein